MSDILAKTTVGKKKKKAYLRQRKKTKFIGIFWGSRTTVGKGESKLNFSKDCVKISPSLLKKYSCYKQKAAAFKH